MNSSKLKLIVIALFFAVNIFFAVKIMDLRDAKDFFTETEIEEAVAVLNKKDIHIDIETIIRKKTVSNTVKLDYDSDAINIIARSIMHGDYGKFTIPDGQRFANDNESFSFLKDYSVEYQQLNHPYAEEDVDKALKKAKKPSEKGEKSINKLFNEFFSKLETAGHKISFEITKYAEEEGVIYIEAVECNDGVQIYGSGIKAVISDEQIVFVVGKIYVSQNVSDYTSDYLDSINILFEIEPTEKNIKNMELVYFPVSDKKTSVYLTPTYRFTYEDGTVSLYDATSGKKRY